jgi:hypothetical protein
MAQRAGFGFVFKVHSWGHKCLHVAIDATSKMDSKISKSGQFTSSATLILILGGLSASPKAEP